MRSARNRVHRMLITIRATPPAPLIPAVSRDQEGAVPDLTDWTGSAVLKHSRVRFFGFFLNKVPVMPRRHPGRPVPPAPAGRAEPAGFADIEVAAQPEWHDLWTRVYRVALDLGDPGYDAPLAALQDEARQRLPVANLVHRVTVTATAPKMPEQDPDGR